MFTERVVVRQRSQFELEMEKISVRNVYNTDLYIVVSICFTWCVTFFKYRKVPTICGNKYDHSRQQ